MRTVLAVEIGSDAFTTAVFSDGDESATSVGRHTTITSIPAVIALRGDTVTVVGDEAEESAMCGGDRVYRHVIDRVGDPVPLVALDGTTCSGANLVAAAVRSLIAQERVAFDDIIIVLPQSWSQHQRHALAAALLDLELAGSAVRMLTRTEAATRWLTATDQLKSGSPMLLCDIESTDVRLTLIGWSPAGALLLRPIAHIAGFGDSITDVAIAEHILARTGPAQSSRRRVFMKACTQARITLTRASEATIEIELPGHREQIMLTRPEFENLIAESLRGAAQAVSSAIDSDHSMLPRIASLILIGDAASIPSVSEKLCTATGIPVNLAMGFAHAGVLGAVLHAVQTVPKTQPVRSSREPRVAVHHKDRAWTRGRKILVSASAAVMVFGGGFTAAALIQTKQTTPNVVGTASIYTSTPATETP